MSFDTHLLVAERMSRLLTEAQEERLVALARQSGASRGTGMLARVRAALSAATGRERLAPRMAPSRDADPLGCDGSAAIAFAGTPHRS